MKERRKREDEENVDRLGYRDIPEKRGGRKERFILTLEAYVIVREERDGDERREWRKGRWKRVM